MLEQHKTSFREASLAAFPEMKGTKSWHLDAGTCSTFSFSTPTSTSSTTSTTSTSTSASLSPGTSGTPLPTTATTTAICVEPLGANYDVLSKISDQMSVLPHLRTKLVNVAVSDYDGIAQFPVSRSGAGYEQAGLNFAGWGKNKAQEFVDVKVMTLKSLLNDLDIHFIDHLSIDVEGEDATV
jgi:FkbM family methyltransferase